MPKTKAQQQQDDIEKNAKEMIEEDSHSEKMPARLEETLAKGKKLQTYLDNKKRKFKNTRYRRKYDALMEYISANLVNTETFQTAMKSQTTGVAYSFVYSNGSYTQIPVLARNAANEGVNRIPLAKEPVAFAKIMTAVSVLAAKVPDAVMTSSDKIYARSQYELWKRTWSNPLANGLNTLQNLYQSVLASGTGAYRIFPRKIEHQAKGQTRILFDDIYRQALDMRRTWIGNSINLFDRWSYGEVVYEIDQETSRFLEKYEDAKYFQLEYATQVQESQIDDSVRNEFVTVRYYEDPLRNKYCVACGNFPIYEGEMPNDDGFGHVIWANCFKNDPNDPYGVGIVEIIRGNVELYDYIERLSAEQVEAEISPLLFGTNTGVGDMTYKRGPNVINPKTAGSTIDMIKTSGNVQQSLLFADKQKLIISENTGINDILAGQAGEGTLGATVILKEAALNRLIIPRNNVVSGLEQDAYMTLSWIKQTYTVEKIVKFNSSEEVDQFMANNPGYFMNLQQTEYVENDEADYESDTLPPQRVKSYTYGVSKKVTLGFDVNFNEDPKKDEIAESTDEYTMPAPELFGMLEERGHVSDRINIVIDASSTLLPSEEINKQRITEIASIVSPQLMQINQAQMTQNNDLARMLLTSLERVLEVNQESIYDWMPKDVYDSIMDPQAQPPQPTAADIAMGTEPGSNPESPSAAGGPMGFSGTPPTPNQIGNPTGPMTQKFNQEIVNPMKGAINASVGRAARTNALTK